MKWEKEARKFFEEKAPHTCKMPSGEPVLVDKSLTMQAFIAGAEAAEKKMAQYLTLDGMMLYLKDIGRGR